MPKQIKIKRDGVRIKFSGERAIEEKFFWIDLYRKASYESLKYVLEEEGFDVKRVNTLRQYKNTFHIQNRELIHVDEIVKDYEVMALRVPLQSDFLDMPDVGDVEGYIVFLYFGNSKLGIGFSEGLKDLGEEKKRSLEEFIDKYVFSVTRTIPISTNGELLTPRTEIKKLVDEILPKKIEKIEKLEPEIQEVRKIEQEPSVEEIPVSKKKHEKIPKHENHPTEEIRRMIEEFQPKTFPAKIAFERYTEAISKIESREELDKLFYQFVVSEENIQEFYNQLYSLMPELLKDKGWLPLLSRKTK